MEINERRIKIMKVIGQSGKLMIPESPMKHIEKIGRICYKSEDKITDGTDRKFVRMLLNNNHRAMIEHYRFIMEVSPMIWEPLEVIKHDHIQMTHSEFKGRDRFVISFNARALMELPDKCDCHHHGVIKMAIKGLVDELTSHIVRKYDCYELFGLDRNEPLPLLSTGVEFIDNSYEAMSDEEWLHHGWFSAHMITDRGITHEIVRHREETSFAQESTRYCNYGLDKFGSEITVIGQGFCGEVEKYWRESVACAESMYFELLECGIKPQMARSVLPTCLKTEIVMTAPIFEWNHFFNLRMRGTTGAPHPMVQALSTEVYKDALNKLNVKEI